MPASQVKSASGFVSPKLTAGVTVLFIVTYNLP